MSPYIADPWAWQESWDRQQEAYLPDREHRFTAMLDAVDAVLDGRPPRVLDLAGGTGTISLRTLARFPTAETTLVDLDPALLAIADASLADRATIITADLGTPEWRSALPHQEYDAVLTATALHWLPADRLGQLYAELRDVLRPGGVFVNADHMPDDTLPELTKRLMERARDRRNARYASGSVLSWSDWWARAGADPALARLSPSGTRSTRPDTARSGTRRSPGTWPRSPPPASARSARSGEAARTPPSRQFADAAVAGGTVAPLPPALR
ncbi:class I SAM-dependent methyltransferase [Micromonospora sp. CA-269861]|uniref:class I SAM-dependent methyltransferase n=1 Tax=Micromonospora sp. CA-269861 TaxID=3239968 RepID=UPI003D8EEC3A